MALERFYKEVKGAREFAKSAKGLLILPGVDGNVALLDVGIGERIGTTTLKDPIVGFVSGVKGLMADVSLKGSKFSKLDKSE